MPASGKEKGSLCPSCNTRERANGSGWCAECKKVGATVYRKERDAAWVAIVAKVRDITGDAQMRPRKVGRFVLNVLERELNND